MLTSKEAYSLCLGRATATSLRTMRGRRQEEALGAYEDELVGVHIARFGGLGGKGASKQVLHSYCLKDDWCPSQWCSQAGQPEQHQETQDRRWLNFFWRFLKETFFQLLNRVVIWIDQLSAFCVSCQTTIILCDRFSQWIYCKFMSLLLLIIITRVIFIGVNLNDLTEFR